MCRIAGIYQLNSSTLKQDVLRMRDSMQHGGPDDEGIFIDCDSSLALGHRRLSLIDLSAAGHQPMSDVDGKLQIIFNGEIYNYQELKTELKSFGYIFKTKTDTEVILKSFLQWGIKCFERFNGMFALALWDKSKNQLILARDHAGIKPLYYSITKNKLIFASEIRAFKAYQNDWPENPKWKIPFLTFGHLPEPFTTLQNVQPLAKGTYAVIDLPSLQITQHTFNKFKFSNTINDLHEAVAVVRDKLNTAVKRHLISDAPIGLFLSGGIDSSLLTLIAHQYIGNNLKTLSIIFEDATFNEQPYQKIIIDKTHANHQSFLITEKLFETALPDILEAMDQPSTDGINSYFISKCAKEYGLTAVLSGLGADELFGGYSSFNHSGKAAFIKKLPSFIPGLAENFTKEKLKKIAFLKRDNHLGEYLFNRGFYSPKQVANLLSIAEKDVYETLDKVAIEQLDKNEAHFNRASHIETHLYMQNQLLKDTDYMSMWHSLEVRVPFLDKELMQAVYSIAPEVKSDKNIGKHLLIKAFNDLLPKEIWQRKKQGFTFPFYKWLKNVKPIERNSNYRHIHYSFKKGKLHWSRYWAYVLTNTKCNIKYFSPDTKDILFLNLVTFSSTGGIEKFNRCFLKALKEIESKGKITVDAISLHDTNVNEKYFSKSNYTYFSGNKTKFISSVIKNSKYYDTIIVGHINLALPGVIIKLLSEKKLMLVAHGIELWKSFTGIKKYFLDNTDKILAVSNFTKQQLFKYNKIAEEKIIVFHNTIDPYFNFPVNFDKPEYLKERYQLNGQKIIYTLTRLSSSEKYKGYDKVLEALPELKKVNPYIKYIIAGKADEAESQRVKKIITSLHLEDNVLLTGFIKDEEVTDHYLLADAFIMPSTMEGFGIVFIEAMACGVPVIAGNVDGSTDALKNGELGTLIDPNSNSDIIQSLSSLMFPGQSNLSHSQLQSIVQHNFGFNTFKRRLEKIITE